MSTVSTSSSRSIRRCTISIQQIDARQWHVVREVWKGAQRADLPPDQNLHFVFAFTLWCDKWPSSRWWLHAASITLGAEKEITVVLHEKLFHNNMKFLHKEYWTVECLWHCYRPRTASCWAACALFSSPVSYSAQVFASFLLVQRLTGRHTAAPVWDKVETMVGADWAHTWVFMIASLIFSQSPTTGQPPPYSAAS